MCAVIRAAGHAPPSAMLEDSHVVHDIPGAAQKLRSPLPVAVNSAAGAIEASISPQAAASHSGIHMPLMHKVCGLETLQEEGETLLGL